MPTTYRFPALLWKTPAGVFGGRLLDGDGTSTAVGSGKRAVLDQLDAYIRHLAQHDSLWEIEPDLFDVELRHVKVAVHPEYRVRGRTFPCAEPVQLRRQHRRIELPQRRVTAFHHPPGDKMVTRQQLRAASTNNELYECMTAGDEGD